MMEISSTSCKYFPELGMEDPGLFQEYSMDGFGYSLDGFEFQSFSGSGDSYNSSYNECFNSKSTQNQNCLPCGVESPESVAPARPTKQLKPNNWTTSCTTTTSSDPILPPNPSASNSSSQIISFANSNSSSSGASHKFYSLDSATVKPKTENVYNDKFDFTAFNISESTYGYNDKLVLKHDKGVLANKTSSVTTRNPVQAQDHVMAERKRREKLSQSFIALSAILPGLKKMDKASVLGDAIKYVKQLQERVKSLEEQAAKRTVESAVFVNRCVLFADDESSSSDENSDTTSHQPLPEIEARVSGREVLIRIHCDKHNGCAPAILSQLQKLHLTVQSSTFLPFGNTTLDVTIIAQMNNEYSMTAKDLVKSLRQALRQFM